MLFLHFPQWVTSISVSPLIINSQLSQLRLLQQVPTDTFYMQSSILNEKQRERFFGKEIANIVNSRLPSKETRVGSHFPRKDILRGITEDISKKNITQIGKTSRLPELTSRNNISMRDKDNISKEPQPQPVNIMQDIQFVPDYFQQNLRFMSQQQSLKQPLPTSLAHQKDLNEGMRMILLDWLVDVHLKLRFFPQTIFITMNLIDRYLAKREVGRSKLQLLGATCMFIAAKYEETYEVPEVNDLVNLCAKAFNKKDFLEMEATVLKALDFDLIVDSMYKFYEPFAKLQNLDNKSFSLGRLILELSLFDLKQSKYQPSLMASSTIYLINKLRKAKEIWSDQMIAATGYEQEALKACSKDLMELLEGLQNHSYAKNLRRKFSMGVLHEVARQRYERKDLSE